jgi:hypothetical protein
MRLLLGIQMEPPDLAVVPPTAAPFWRRSTEAPASLAVMPAAPPPTTTTSTVSSQASSKVVIIAGWGRLRSAVNTSVDHLVNVYVDSISPVVPGAATSPQNWSTT